jgi:hypothetical protein
VGELMVPLTTASSSFEARVVAARLGSEGFLCELRGNVDGPYPVGPVGVFVSADQVEEARELLLADEVAEIFEAPAHDGAGTRSGRHEGWFAALVVAVLVVFVVLRVLSAAA